MEARLQPLGVACVLLATSACISVRPIDPSAPVELGDGEGILAVHLISSLPVSALKFSQATVVADLPPGDHLVLAAVRAGEYRWSRVVFPAGEGDASFYMTRADFWKFRVVPGRISYPGTLEFRGASGARGVSIEWRYRNRSAMVLHHLQREYPQLLARHPPTFAGRGRDDFLDHFVATILAPASPRVDPSAP